MYNELKIALRLLLVMTALTGAAYTIAVSGIGHVFFQQKAQGSVIEVGGKRVGSELLGQSFTSPRYFWGRPSATTPAPYNGALSSGSNLAPGNPAVEAAVRRRIADLRAVDPGNSRAVPVDLVAASASGLDPHISLAAAEFQVARVARARALPEARVRALVTRHTQGRTLGFLGEPRVNVLQLNLALDELIP